MSRDISIFLFSLDYPLPVFLDKHHVSRAFPASDLIIAVQSSYHLYETPVSCNRLPVYCNLNSPYAALLQSMLQLLTAALPHHLAHSSPHSPSSQWSMSVGPSVLSPLASGLSFSRLEVDAMRRFHPLLHLTRLTHTVNTAVLTLRAVPTSLHTAGLLRSPRWQRAEEELRTAYTRVGEVLELVSLLLETRQWEWAARQVAEMDEAGARLQQKVERLMTLMAGKECENVAAVVGFIGGEVEERRRLGLGRWRWSCYLLAVLLCLLMALYRAVQRFKPKIN